MKKIKIYLGAAVMICLCSISIGCAKYTENFLLSAQASQKECRLCGNGKNCLKSIYKNCTGIGILCLNDWRVVEIQTSSQDSPLSNNSDSYIWEEKSAYKIKVTRIESRKIALMHYKSTKKNTLDMIKLNSVLCHKCIKNAEEAVHINGNHKGRPAKAVCMVQFPTMELYGIQQDFQYYFIGDYYAQAHCKDDEISLTVFLTPEM